MEIVDYSEGDGWCARLAKQAVWIKENAKPTGEFLYEENHEEDGDYRYEIIKKTEKRIYILVPNGHEDKVLQLDRIAMEKNGEVWHWDNGTKFYAEPYEVRCAEQIAENQRMKMEKNEEYQHKLQFLTDDEVKRWRENFPKLSDDCLVEIACAIKLQGLSVDRHRAS